MKITAVKIIGIEVGGEGVLDVRAPTVDVYYVAKTIQYK